MAVCTVLLMEHVFLAACTTAKGPLPNVSSRLLSLLQEVEGTSAQRNKGLVPLQEVRRDEAGRVEVMIQMTEITAETLRELQVRGSSIEIYDPAQHLVQAWIPMERLREVAGLPFVKFLDLPNYGVTNRLGN